MGLSGEDNRARSTAGLAPPLQSLIVAGNKQRTERKEVVKLQFTMNKEEERRCTVVQMCKLIEIKGLALFEGMLPLVKIIL